MTARTAALVRCVAIGYLGVQLAIWQPFYLADPRRLAGPAVALAWAVAVVVILFRHWPAWPLAVADTWVYVALALSSGWWVVPAMRGDTANWLFIMMAGQVLVPVWFTGMPLSALLPFLSALAYWTGVLLFPAAGTGRSAPASATAALLAVAAAVWCGRSAVQHWARRADAALARADADSRAQYVELTRNIERREHERLLHDTVLNTLTALARGGGDPRAAVSRCQHDVALMEHELSRPAEEARPPRHARHARQASVADGGLLAGVEGVAAQMRARGLLVHVGGPGGRTAGPVIPVPVPVRVATAMTLAVREALSNVASHAGAPQAWIEFGPAGPDGSGGVQVTIRDVGRGFDPARIDQGRLGLRRSIVERLADQGGHATINSAPGRGTEVILSWPREPGAGEPQPGAGQPPAGRPGAGQPGARETQPGASTRRAGAHGRVPW